ncbi:class I SAM-dependent methyltransferase [Paenibacillus sp. GCM10027626]|uniref:class I SAM-dependent methyltransferase n=1 Tax=Paenibacillus sp. GCM10027626 TaxID=3273411 RepID=UPI00363473A6
MNNQWNKLIYKAWAPIYDRLFDSSRFRRARERVFQKAGIRDGSRLLLVGVGTGADLQFLTGLNLKITAIDLSKDMIAQARSKAGTQDIQFLEMDAQQLAFSDHQFDVVIANLILSVVPDANQCFDEIVRVTREDGQIIIMDKFAPQSGKLPLGKALLRPIISLFGTDIGRSFEQIISRHPERIHVEHDEGVMLGGMYRGILLKKTGQRK